MGARAGRRVIVRWNGEQIPGVREKAASFNGEPLNITSDEDSGWQTLLGTPEEGGDVGEKSIEFTMSGVTKSAVLKNAWFGQNRIGTLEVTYPDGSIISGVFHLATYSETDPYNEASTFESTFQSSGEPTYTPYS